MRGIDRERNIVGLIGGLGNQLFQLSFAHWLESQTDIPSLLDLSAYRSVPRYLAVPPALVAGRLANPGLLRLTPHVMGRWPRGASAVRTLIGPRSVVMERDLGTPKAALDKHPAWYYGYWQVAEIAATMVPTLAHEIQGKHDTLEPATNVAMHVRRGDMVGHGTEMSAEGLGESIAALQSRGLLGVHEQIQVMTDDPAWCRQQPNSDRFLIAEARPPLDDMAHLSMHSVVVLSRSTFSWWAGALASARGATVVAPAPFLRGTDGSPLELPAWQHL